MPRCPDYLRPDDFEKLAKSLGVNLTDAGIGALGEIIEGITTQILKESSRKNGGSNNLDLDIIISTSRALGIKVKLNNPGKKVIKKAEL
jgi:hypothetical protein